MGLARASLAQREEEQALEALRKVLALQPENLEAQSHFTTLQAYAGDESAVERLQEIAAAPQAGYFEHFNLARVLARQGEVAGAEAAYAKALAKGDPNDAFIHFELGRLALRREAFDVALGHLEKCTTVLPNEAAPRVLLSRAHLGRGDLTRALQVATEARELDARLVDVHEQLFQLHMLAGAPAAAVRNALDLRALEPSNVNYLYMQGVSLLTAGEASEAKEVLEQARRQVPDSLDVGRALAQAHELLGEVTQARELLETLSRQSPDAPDVANDLAVLYLGVPGGPEKARKVLEPVLRVDPDNAAANLNYALALAATGAGPKALPYAEKAKASPSATVREQAEQLVKELKGGGKGRQKLQP
jgi:tetratricopeptide (TPR) repeat protein